MSYELPDFEIVDMNDVILNNSEQGNMTGKGGAISGDNGEQNGV